MFHSSKVEFVRSFFGGNIYLKKSFRLFLTFTERWAKTPANNYSGRIDGYWVYNSSQSFNPVSIMQGYFYLQGRQVRPLLHLNFQIF